MKKIVFFLILGALIILFLEGVSFGVLAYLARYKHVYTYSSIPFNITPEFERLVRDYLDHDEPHAEYVQFDADLGWTMAPNAVYGKVNGQVLASSNNIGTRNSRDYGLRKAPGKTRIATFGDSFTHGSSIFNDATFQEILERENPNLEVLNFGVSGYGMDQAYLRYMKEGRKFNSDIVLICYMTENLARHVNVFGSFYDRRGISLNVKPRFVLNGDGIQLMRSPIQKREDMIKLLDRNFIRQMAQNDFWSGVHHDRSAWDKSSLVQIVKLARHTFGREKRSPISDDVLLRKILDVSGNHFLYNTDSEAYQITTRLFDRFYRDVELAGSVPVIVLFPDQYDIEAYMNGEERRYVELAQYLRSKNYRVVDMIDILVGLSRQHGLKQITHSHYTPDGNTGVAFGIHQYLMDEGLIGGR